MEKKSRRKMLRKTITVGITPIVLSAALLIALLSVVECCNAVRLGRSSIERNAEGEVTVPDEKEFSEFVFSWAPGGPIAKVVGIVGHSFAFVGFFVFRLCRTGWSVKPAYSLTISIIWLVVSVIVFVKWLKKWRSARRFTRTGRTRFGMDCFQYRDLMSLCRITERDMIFVVLAVLVSLFQIVLIQVRFMMTPVLVLAIIFILIEVGRQLWHYANNVKDETGTTPLLRIKRRIKMNKLYRKFYVWKMQRF